MIDLLNFFIIQVVLLAVVTSVHTYLGLHVIKRGIVFSDLALDQLAALGVIIGIGFGISGGGVGSYIVSFLAVLVGAFLLAYVKPQNKQIPHEAIIGIIYGLALVASLMVADKISGGLAYVTQTLCGTLLWVSWPLVFVTVGVYILLAVFHYKFRNKFMAITEKKQLVKNENQWDFLFFITLGIITVLIVPIAGVLLAYSFLMIPAAISLFFTREWKKGLQIGWTVGFIASLAGLFSSYFFNLSYGPSLVLAQGIFFLGALILKTYILKKEE